MNPQRNRRPLTQAVTLQCLDAWGRSIDLPTLLSYDPADPWAVRVSFGHPSQAIDWLIGRDLLLRGLTDPVGEGDVLLWPSIDDCGRAAIVLELCSPSGRMIAQAPTRELGAFLTRTLSEVAQGAEQIDLDLLVESLTDSQPQ